MLRCSGPCNRLYSTLVDFGISDDMWRLISPRGDAGGVLCIDCASAKLEALGIHNVPMVIRSGAFVKVGD